MLNLLLLLACAGTSDDTDATDEELSLSLLVEEDARGAWLAAWEDPSGAIWIVGGQPEAGAVLVGDAAAGFSTLSLPKDTPLLNWVHGTGADDVWVGGVQGALLHFDGSDWEDRSLEMEEAVWGLYAVDADEVWAVGGASSFGGDVARAYRSTGGVFEELALPEELAASENLFKVSHDGERAWIVGAAGAAAVSDGDGLTAVPTGYGRDLVTVAADEEPVVVVGGRGTGVVFQGDGATLTQVGEAPSGLSGVDHLPDGSVVVAGEYGYVGVFDPQEATMEVVNTGSNAVLHGVLVTNGGDVYAVGGNLYTSGDSYEGQVLYGAWGSP